MCLVNIFIDVAGDQYEHFFFLLVVNFHVVKKFLIVSVISGGQNLYQCSFIVVEKGAADIFIFVKTMEFLEGIFLKPFS